MYAITAHFYSTKYLCNPIYDLSKKQQLVVSIYIFSYYLFTTQVLFKYNRKYLLVKDTVYITLFLACELIIFYQINCFQFPKQSQPIKGLYNIVALLDRNEWCIDTYHHLLNIHVTRTCRSLGGGGAGRL